MTLRLCIGEKESEINACHATDFEVAIHLE